LQTIKKLFACFLIVMGIRKISFSIRELVAIVLICLLLAVILGVSAILILIVLPLLLMYLFLNIFVKNSMFRELIWLLFIVLLVYLLIKKIF